MKHETRVVLFTLALFVGVFVFLPMWLLQAQTADVTLFTSPEGYEVSWEQPTDTSSGASWAPKFIETETTEFSGYTHLEVEYEAAEPFGFGIRTKWTPIGRTRSWQNVTSILSGRDISTLSLTTFNPLLNHTDDIMIGWPDGDHSSGNPTWSMKLYSVKLVNLSTLPPPPSLNQSRCLLHLESSPPSECLRKESTAH